MANVKGGLMKQQAENKQVQAQQVQAKSVSMLMNEMLDSSGIKNRIKEILGARAPQFTSALVSLVNATPQMQQVFKEAPQTIIQAGLKAAQYDMPIDQALGYAYIVPFKNSKKDAAGNWSSRMEASFILGYKGMYQMAMRTGVYKKLNVVDVREGELKAWNPLTEDIELEFIEDEEKREQAPIIGYVGFFRLVNGMEKYTYWSMAKIMAHEAKFRKGKTMNPVWSSNKEAMCRKTVLRDLIGRWGIMSIDYRTATPETMAFAQAAATGEMDDELETLDTEAAPVVEETAEGRTVDTSTGEIVEPALLAEN